MYLIFTEPWCYSKKPNGFFKKHPTLKLLMRIGFLNLFVILCSMHLLLAHSGRSQDLENIHVTLEMHNEHLQKLFKKIEDQTGLLFAYQPRLVDSFTNVNIEKATRSVKATLDIAFRGTSLGYRQVNNSIIIYMEGDDEIKKEIIQLVDSTIHGKVTDTDGSPLPGVNVLLKGTTRGTTTDVNGEYAIEAETTDILVFSFIGYKTIEEHISSRTVIDIAMESDISTLNEVVVIGYGKQEKDEVTAAVTTTPGTSLVRSNAADLTNALVGRVPGVITIQNTAEPGLDAAQVYIRGRSTLNDNGPLVMVDGIQREMNQIDPNEIESITVLKDAAAVAIYGVRGGNGVILITTKRGATGKPTFSYTGYVGFQNPTQTPKYLNSYDYARLYNEAALNDDPSATPPFSDEDLQKYRDHSDPFTHPDIDWFDEIIEPNAPQTRHSLSVTGGSDRIKYFMLLGLFDQAGMYRTVNFKKYNFRLNVDAGLTKSTTLSVGVFGGLERKKEPGVPDASRFSEGIYGVVTYIPNNAFPVRNEDGSLASLWGQNPIGEINESGYIHNDYNTIQTSFVLDQKLDFLTKGLSFKIVYSKDFGYGFGKSWLLPYTSYLLTDDGYEELLNRSSPSLEETFSQFDNSTFEGHINYTRNFGKHQVGALVLYTQSAFYDNGFYASRINYPTTAVAQLSAGPDLNKDNGGNTTESGREGVVGRISYGFDGKYLLEANFAYNGSENFPPGNRYGFFPAASVGWIISNESFFQNASSTISNLKIRASYGQVGNDKVGGRRFMYIPTVNYSPGYTFGGSPVQGVALGEPANPNVTWERAKKTNIGLDVNVKGSLLTLRADVFYERRSDILGSRNQSVPATYGFELPIENFAKVDNRGYELELGHNGKVGDLNYFVNLNFTHARNEVVFIDEPANIPEERRRTGRPINQFFGYVAQGFYQTEDELTAHPRFEDVEPRLGDIKYQDINNDGIIDTDDITAVGSSDIPQNVFGMSIGGTFKGFDLTMLWQGASGYNVNFRDGTLEFLYGSQAWEHHLDRWTPENPNASYPRLSLERYSYKQEDSSFWIEDAGYIRLKNIELGYTFPNTLFPKGAINKLRLYVSATNFLTYSKVKEFDPEAPSGFPLFYPQQKVFFAGINLTF